MENNNPDNLEKVIDKLDPKYFFFDLPLYEEVKTDDSDKIYNLITYTGRFDAYNFALGDNTTFVGYDNYSGRSLRGDGFDYFDIKIKCTRSNSVFRFYVLASENEIQKIGQFPSLASLNIEQIKEYEGVLSREKLKEFIRAIGLRAHGVGIGSFVYLRRIFEFLIEKEHVEAKKEENWDEDLYEKSRIVEKIELLKEYLPEFLIENKDLYGILSLGIHELSEEDCLKYFDALKMGIIEILEEKVIEKQRKDRKKKTRDSIQLVRNIIASKKK